MLEIRYSRKFEKQFKKLPKHIKEAFLEIEETFRLNPFNSKLKTHKLHGKLREFFAFSVTHDYRVIFSFDGDKIVIFLIIGTHSIYKDMI